MTDNKVFSLIFNERRGKSTSRHPHQVRPTKKKDDEYEVIVPPSMRKNQNFMNVQPPMNRREPEFRQRSAAINHRQSFSSTSAVKVDPELRDGASLSSLDKEIIQPSSRPHLNVKSSARIPPSQQCLVRSRTLQSRLPIPRQNATAGLLPPVVFDRRSHSYNNRSRTSFHEIQREINQIVLATTSESREKVHTSRTESRDDMHEAPTTSTAANSDVDADAMEKEKEDPVTTSESTCTWWKCW